MVSTLPFLCSACWRRTLLVLGDRSWWSFIIMMVVLDSFRPSFLLPFFFFAPFISLVWIGKVEPFFVLSIYTLVVGWYINTLSVPAYISNMGVGQLRQNIIQHIATAGFNILFGVVGGYLLEGYGVVSAWSLSLILSSGILIYLFHQKNHLNFQILRFEGDQNYFISLIILIIASCFSNYFLSVSSPPWVLVFICYSFIYIGWLFWILKNTPLILEMRLRFANLRF